MGRRGWQVRSGRSAEAALPSPKLVSPPDSAAQNGQEDARRLDFGQRREGRFIG
jgi:hypothetical protein